MKEIEFKLSETEIKTLKILENIPWNDIKLYGKIFHDDRKSFYSRGIIIEAGALFYITAAPYTDKTTDLSETILNILHENKEQNSIDDDLKRFKLINNTNKCDSISGFSVFDAKFMMMPKRISIVSEKRYGYSYLHQDLRKVDLDGALLIESGECQVLITTDAAESVRIETEAKYIKDGLACYDDIRAL